ncbi:MAG: TetR/AcrR family transcriptional regulator [Caulobacter sp.]|nr:TetR/AcrR family transcriptional regulator [Caulobacter sp.]
MPKPPANIGRSNQRRRTRKDLLEAAARLMKGGSKPSLEDVAEEAMVSRATAYRYFANLDDLLVEAAVDMSIPPVSEIFPEGAPEDALTRLGRIDDALDTMMANNEGPLRLMLAAALEQGRNRKPGDPPRRQNRRTPLIEAALEPWRSEFEPAAFRRLTNALALVVGSEAMIVFKDVTPLSEVEAKATKAWVMAALVEAAKKGL